MKHELTEILEVTLRCMNITPEQWEERKDSRDAKMVMTRQLVSLIAYKEGHYCTDIAAFLNQHRTTILHHITTMQDLGRLYPKVHELIKEVTGNLSINNNLQTSMTVRGWIARGRNKHLLFSPNKPEDINGYWFAEGSKTFPSDQFQQITYGMGPVRVKIEVTLEDNEAM